MLDKIPTDSELTALLGEPLFEVWRGICAIIEEKYDTDKLWDKGGKAWVYEYKYRRGGKTLCALYAREKCVGLMMIFGRDEREKVEKIKAELCENVIKTYDAAKVYHDGKWVMFTPIGSADFGDYMRLLAIKRKPNIK